MNTCLRSLQDNKTCQQVINLDPCTGEVEVLDDEMVIVHSPRHARHVVVLEPDAGICAPRVLAEVRQAPEPGQ